MKRILILLLLSAMLLSACTAPTSCNAPTATDLRTGMSEKEAIEILGEVSYVKASQYIFFENENGQSVVLYFNESAVLSRIETYDAPETTPDVDDVLKLAPDTTVYEVIKALGVPTKHTIGSHFQLSFKFGMQVTVITTWKDTTTDHMSLVYKPVYIDHTATTDGTELDTELNS
ncbi:MAG: hypothetical protein IJX80_03890 [Clostridia bacterium]|nr:hypothetical protein [Clostridia bacterium]